MKRNYALKYLGKSVNIHVDRPLGSKHPKHGFTYSVNYGYVPDTLAPDGEEIDAYLLGVFDPVKEFSGKCIAIVQRTDDNDDKLIIVPEGKYYTESQITALVEFQERFFTSKILFLIH